MDLLSLPQGMLANVLKYSNFETLTRMRKINKTIDGTSVVYGANKPRIHFLEVNSKWEIEVVYRISDIEESVENKNITMADLTIEEYLKKIRCKILILNRITILDGCLAMLNRTENAKRISIVLAYCNLTASLEDLKFVLAKFKTSTLKIDSDCATMEGKFMTDKVISYFLPTVNNFHFKENVGITDISLRNAAIFRPTTFELPYTQIGFSLEEVLLTIKNIMKVGLKPSSKWTLGSIKMNSTDEMQTTIDRIKSEINEPNCLLVKLDDQAFIYCRVGPSAWVDLRLVC